MESLGGSVLIWEIGPVSTIVRKSYMIESLVVHDMGEVKVIFPFP